jgi:hypothetical protein
MADDLHWVPVPLVRRFSQRPRPVRQVDGAPQVMATLRNTYSWITIGHFHLAADGSMRTSTQVLFRQMVLLDHVIVFGCAVASRAPVYV